MSVFIDMNSLCSDTYKLHALLADTCPPWGLSVRSSSYLLNEAPGPGIEASSF
jgi:hypothetical protein